MTLLDLLIGLLGQGPKLDQIIALMTQMAQQGEKMSAQLDALTAQVERMSTVTDSVLALVKTLADQIEAARGDPVAIQALADALRADADRIQQAVQTNTPAQAQAGARPGHPHPHPGGRP